MLNHRWLGVALLFLFAPAGLAAAEEADPRADYIRKHYSKFEYKIPMRDGTLLHTAVYRPNDTANDYPILMFRTPYSVGPYGAARYARRLGPSEEFEREGFIFVFQDVRGRYLSEGEFVNMRPHISGKRGKQFDESSDTYDTVDWLVKNIPHNNGRVGQWGISYPGFYSAAGMIDSHPALKAVSPQAPIADWFWDDMHRHGAFVLPLAFNFFSSFGVVREEPTVESPDRFDHKTKDGYQFFLDLGPVKNANERHFKREIPFWNAMTEHPNYDEFWQSRNLLPHLKKVSAAVLVVGGWFDTEDLYGPLKIYEAVERLNPGTDNRLVMGPWSHGQWNRGDGRNLGSADFGSPTSELFREQVQLPFFRQHLKDGADPKFPEAWVFETGANRWRSFDAWPPKQAQRKRLYLDAAGTIDDSAPTESGAAAADSFVSDPSKPVPYTMEITTRWAKDYMTEDQRFAAWRPDVLVYRTEVLEQDMTLAGPVFADLWVTTTGTAADWIVKIVDEYPGEALGDADDDEADAYAGGHQMLVRGEVMRGRFRNGYEKPEPFVPDEAAHVRFELHDLLHTFEKGHRLMVQVQSTWFPFIDRNPQTYVDNIFEAGEADFKSQTHRILRSAKHPSAIEIGILPTTP